MSLSRSEMDVSNAGRGRRVRKPSDKALAAAQANQDESSSDDGSSSESRLVRVAMTRNKARKRRSESVSSGNDIDSDERRSADSPAAPVARGQTSNDKPNTSTMRAHYEASSGPEQKPVVERSSALLGAEALMGLAALASSAGAASPAPVPSIPPPPPATPSTTARAALTAPVVRQRAAPKSMIPPPAAAVRSKPRKESWAANVPAAAATPVAGTVPNKRLAIETKTSRASGAPKAIAPAGSQPEQRTWKRCATHVAIAYYIFYRQRHQLLQHLAVTNPPMMQKMAPYAMDPTYDARVLKERSMELAKRKQQMMNPHLQYILNSPVKQDPRTQFGSYAGGFPNSATMPPHQQMQMSQLAMLHPGAGAGGPALPANFHYFGPPPVGSTLPPPPALLAAPALAPLAERAVANGAHEREVAGDQKPIIKEEIKDTQRNGAALPSAAKEATVDRASM